MKIAVVNFSGNVCKTMLTKHLFAQNLSAKRVSIETINFGAENADARIKAAQYKLLTGQKMMGDDENLVIDIGAQYRSRDGASQRDGGLG